MLAENWKEFMKPSKMSLTAGADEDRTAQIVVEPLERGFGITIGNSLRRVLLSSIYGTAITAVKIAGIIHELDSINGVREDLIDIILNFKLVIIKGDTATKKKAKLSAVGPCEVTAGQIELPQGLEIINKDLVICTLDKDAKFDVEFVIEVGKGYRDATPYKAANTEVGLIPIDAVFSPITKVAYKVENSRVGQVTDYDKLVMDIETNGSITPESTLAIAAKIMKEQVSMFINFDENAYSEAVAPAKAVDLKFDPVLLKKVDELELSVRSQNCLKNENIIYLGDLVRRTEYDMLRTPNFGRKSLNEIKAILSSLSLGFGMDIASWPPEDIDSLAKSFEDPFEA
jgi:DNA-directed RNA polymerase subunit alpha